MSKSKCLQSTHSTFLASNQLTTCIHWFTDSVIVLSMFGVIHFCDIVWSVRVDAILTYFVRYFLISVSVLQIQLTIEGASFRLTQPHVCVYPKPTSFL